MNNWWLLLVVGILCAFFCGLLIWAIRYDLKQSPTCTYISITGRQCTGLRKHSGKHTLEKP